nr:DNA topoisomerase [Cloacibacillus porcorum]
MPTLQSEAAKKYDISPADTLKIAQRLYELKYTTYPRSDCQYLPESLYENRARVLGVIKKSSPEYEAYNFDADLKSAAWNTGKIEEHFAIVPTGEMPRNLSEKEQLIFDLIARRYAAQFLPPQEFAVVSIEYDIEEEFFKATSRQCTKEGWHLLYGKERDGEEDEKEPETRIPDAVTGEPVGIRELMIAERKTTPPKRFTESTLLDAMNNIHLYVEDPEVKKILKETSGIGTAATQAKIIETLQQRQFIVKDKKALISTPKGRKLIAEIDDMLRKPDMTALWEAALRGIQRGERDLDSFIGEISDTVKKNDRTAQKNRQRIHPRVASKRRAAGNPMPRVPWEPHAAAYRQRQEKQILGLQRLRPDTIQRTRQTPENCSLPPLRPPERAHKGNARLLLALPKPEMQKDL